MLDIKFIRENPDKVKKAINDRNTKLDLDELLKLDEERRRFLVEADKLKNKRNIESDEIAKLKRQGKDAKSKMVDMKSVSQKIKEIDSKVVEIDQNMMKIVINIPNIPHSSVPVGPDATTNKLVKEWGKMPNFQHKILNHIELGKNLNIIDFSGSAKLAGSGFSLFVADGARLVRSLINFMLDIHTSKHGYKEIWPPVLVNRASMTATGQLPKLEEDMYKLKDDDLFLIPTAEVPVTNIKRDTVLD
jgi:seryl-tRNA synthetase